MSIDLLSVCIRLLASLFFMTIQSLRFDRRVWQPFLLGFIQIERITLPSGFCRDLRLISFTTILIRIVRIYTKILSCKEGTFMLIFGLRFPVLNKMRWSKRLLKWSSLEITKKWWKCQISTVLRRKRISVQIIRFLDFWFRISQRTKSLNWRSPMIITFRRWFSWRELPSLTIS